MKNTNPVGENIPFRWALSHRKSKISDGGFPHYRPVCNPPLLSIFGLRVRVEDRCNGSLGSGRSPAGGGPAPGGAAPKSADTSEDDTINPRAR